jgi:heat shock protein beta
MRISVLLLLVLCIFLLASQARAQEDFDEVASSSVEEEEDDLTHAPAHEFKDFSDEEKEAMTESAETFSFQAEVSRLMDIIINSLYKNRDIFLRELISNASDALDKIRFIAISSLDALGDTPEMEIRISFDSNSKSVSIRDTGIGMTRSDLVSQLGTVAKSGTTNFVEAMAEDQDLSLIGQFGVGFYSVYLVADVVRVTSKHNDDDQYIWESTAGGTFTVTKDPRGNTLGRGTEITLFLKEDAEEFLNQDRLESLVDAYSDFITWPIFLQKEKTRNIILEEGEEDPEGVEGVEDEDEEEELDDPDAEDLDEGDLPKKRRRQRKIKEKVWERVNSKVALWTRDRSDITDEEYQNFYLALANDFFDQGAATWIHFKAEGEVMFNSILYAPLAAPSNMYEGLTEKTGGIRLYVRKVLITSDFEEMIPRYLSFLRGVVDSDDLPLNVGRETLQQHKILRVMAKKIVRKALEMIRKFAGKKHTDPDTPHPYHAWWEEFGKSIKLGVIEDQANRSRLGKLLRFRSSQGASDDDWVGLDHYIGRMKDWQDQIYFIAGDSLEAVKQSPFLEKFLAKDLEVLYLVEPLDEYVFQHLSEYDGKRLQNIAKEGIVFGDEDQNMLERRQAAYKDMFKPLTKFMRKALGDKLSRVSISDRLENAPCMITTSQYGHSANMERVMKSQTFSDPNKMAYLKPTKTLELNPRHPIIREMLDRVEEDPEDESLKDFVHILYDTALVESGFQQDDIADHATRVYRTVSQALKLDSMELMEDIEIDWEEEEEEEEEELEFEDEGDFEFDFGFEDDLSYLEDDEL